jgi:hypothetical protein
MSAATVICRHDIRGIVQGRNNGPAPVIKHLRRGCLHPIRDTDGRVHRHKVTSLAFKGERDPAGVEATWVVGTPAARAIRVLEQLQPPHAELLFEALPRQPGQRNCPTFTPTNIALSHGSTGVQLNELVGWINRYCAARHRADSIPKVDNRDWRLSTSQFRRTLAWFIARAPAVSSPARSPTGILACKCSKATPGPPTAGSAPRSSPSKPSPAANISWPPSTPTTTNT